MKKVNHMLTDMQINALKVLAKKTGLTVSDHIRRAVDKYLEKRRS